MMYKVANCGAGINFDLSAEELGDGVWSASENIRFSSGYARLFGGFKQTLTAPAVTPYFITHYATTTTRFIVHAGISAIYVDDGNTRTDITGTAPTGAINNRWTGGSLNGVLVLNNGVDIPMFWGGNTAVNLASLTGWNAAWKAKSIRPFKNFLIALNITKSTTVYPHMVKWSDIAVPGSIPASWDEANAALDAGEVDLAETPDLLVDCLPMGDVNIIYKERSMYAMSYIGAPYIFRFQRLPGNYGLLAPGCVVDTPVGHVVLTAGDVVLHSGSQPISIANSIVRDYIFDNIDSNHYQRSFVTLNPKENEVWICFPHGSSATCNRACVWNWIDKTWSIRTLDNATYGSYGQIDEVDATDTWAAVTGSWDDSVITWNGNRYSAVESRLFMCHSTPKLSVVDGTTSDFGSAIPAYMARTGITMGSPETVKTVRSVYPRFDGVDGTTISIQVGSSMAANAATTWQPAQTFTIGTDLKIDSFATGRYIAVKFTNVAYANWRMRSFDIDFVTQGRY